jgi:hypothetical protein
MHSVLNTFFQAPVSVEEKKRRLKDVCKSASLVCPPLRPLACLSV